MPHDVLPTFFFSYTRRDAERKPSPTVQRFFEDLQDVLEERTVGLTQGTRLGTYDRRIGQGRDWDDELSRGLKLNKALIAIATPSYFDNENCGKEIAVFVRRHVGVRIDRAGCLRNITNILHIRWLNDPAYESNGVKDALVHQILRKVTWTPAEDGRKSLADAVHRYRDKGMAMCVKPNRDYYIELLRAFAESVKRMPQLPEARFRFSWEDIRSAFATDWAEVVEAEVDDHAPESAAPLIAQEPTGPADVAMFYLTRRQLIFDPRPVSFADQLIDGPRWRQSPVVGRPDAFLALVQAVQEATTLEHLKDFHCASLPQVPDEPDALINQLAALTARNVIVAVIIDPALWSGANATDLRAREMLKIVMTSDRWGGPMIVPRLSDSDLDIAAFAGDTRLPRAVVALPQGRDDVVTALRSALVQERGRIVRASGSAATDDNERPPLLRGPGSSR
jgi:hypothetical protein